MTYDDLTQEQKEIVGQAERWLRGMLSSFYAMLDVADFPLKEAFWNANVAPLLAQMQNSVVIPNTSGLAGAADVTVGDIGNVFTWVTGINGDMNTNIALVVKFIGVNAE